MNKLTALEKINVVFLKLITSIFLNYKKNFHPSELKKGLIFCQMGIGNTVLFLPVIRNLIINRPDIELTVIVGNKPAYDILADQGLPVKIVFKKIDRLSFIQKTQFFYKLRKEKFDFSLMNFLGQRKENIYLNIFVRFHTGLVIL